jgi:hypothetical protein
MPLPQNRNNEGSGGMIPPQAQPVRRFTTPSVGDGFFAERVDVSARDYVPLVRGTPYSTIKNALKTVIDQFPTLYFLKETLDPFYYPWALRWWSTDEDAESTYNAEITYLNENVDYPSYSRVYTMRREEYEADPTIAIGSPFTGLIAVRVDAGGSGYTKDDPVVFSSGDATAVLVVDADGAIINVVLTNEGSGYDSDNPPAVTVPSPVDNGVGASLTALMQDKTAVLTSQKKVELADDDPLSQEKVRVIRIYETLPGPFDYSTRLDPDGVVVGIATRRNIAADIESGESVVGDIWTKKTKKGDQNSFVADEIVETRALPGNEVPSVLIGNDLYGAYTYRTLYYGDYITPEVSESGGVIHTVEKKDVTEAVAEKIVTDRKWVDDADYSLTIPNLIPEWARAFIPLHVVSHKVKGFASQPAELGFGEFTRAEKQLDAVFKRVTVEYLNFDELPVILTGLKETNDKKQVVDIIMTLELDSTTPTLPTATRDVDFKKLGNGMAIEITRVVPRVFPEDSYTKSIENLIPAKLRAAVPISESTIDEVGSPSTNPTLLTGELSRTEGRLTEYTKRTRITSLGTISVPVTITDKGLTEKFGGSTTTITYVLNTHGAFTIDQGILVLDSKIEDLGNGYDIKTTEAADPGAWMYLYGQDYDESLDVVIPFLEKTTDSGSGEIGTPKTDIKPDDIWRSKKRTIDSAAAEAVLGAYLMQYPSKINLSMPDKLVSLTSQIESQTGSAAEQQLGSSDGFGSYSINLDLNASATASATIIPEVIAVIKQFYGANIDATHFIFFLPNPVTSADVLAKINALIAGSVSAWPKFNPQTLSMLVVGGNAALKVTAVSKGSYSQQSDLSSQSSTAGGGTGYSRAKGLTLRRMEISPTIHGDLTVEGVTTDTVDLNAYCQSEAVGLGPFESTNETDSITAFTSPTSFAATDGATDWPSSGKFLYRVDGRPYKYGFVMFHAIVVDAADFPSS